MALKKKVKIPKKIKKICKKMGIRLTVKRGNKKVKKSLNVLLKEIQRKKSKFGSFMDKVKSAPAKGWNYTKKNPVKVAIGAVAIVGTAALIIGTGGAAAPLVAAEAGSAGAALQGVATVGALGGAAKSALNVEHVAANAGKTMSTAMDSVNQVQGAVGTAQTLASVVPKGQNGGLHHAEQSAHAATVAANSANTAAHDVHKAADISAGTASSANNIAKDVSKSPSGEIHENAIKDIHSASEQAHSDAKQGQQHATEAKDLASQAKEHADNANKHVEEAKAATDPHKKQESLDQAKKETDESVSASAKAADLAGRGFTSATDGLAKMTEVAGQIQTIAALKDLVPSGGGGQQQDQGQQDQDQQQIDPNDAQDRLKSLNPSGGFGKRRFGKSYFGHYNNIPHQQVYNFGHYNTTPHQQVYNFGHYNTTPHQQVYNFGKSKKSKKRSGKNKIIESLKKDYRLIKKIKN